MSTDDYQSPEWELNDDAFYTLRLFVAGTSPASVRAINNLNEILEEYLKGRYTLEIIDVHQQRDLAKQDNVTAVPMLIKKDPIPKRLLVGDMSNRQRVLRGLGLTNSDTEE